MMGKNCSALFYLSNAQKSRYPVWNIKNTLYFINLQATQWLFLIPECLFPNTTCIEIIGKEKQLQFFFWGGRRVVFKVYILLLNP